MDTKLTKLALRGPVNLFRNFLLGLILSRISSLTVSY